MRPVRFTQVFCTTQKRRRQVVQTCLRAVRFLRTSSIVLTVLCIPLVQRGREIAHQEKRKTPLGRITLRGKFLKLCEPAFSAQRMRFAHRAILRALSKPGEAVVNIRAVRLVRMK